jgi:hypothetical protein
MPNRGPEILPSIRRLIIAQALHYRDKPRAALAADLKETIERMGLVSPGEETMMRIISSARNHTPDPQDMPWSLGAEKQLNERPVPAEAIPHILKVKELVAKEGMTEVTIRHAYWIARLYVFDKLKTRDLWKASYIYAIYELSCQLANVPCDTSRFDKSFLDGSWEKVLTNWINTEAKEGRTEAYERITGTEALIGINDAELPANTAIFFENGLAFALKKGPEVVCLGKAEEVISILKKQRMIKKSKIPRDNERFIIITERPIFLKKRQSEAKNERSHNQEVQE